MSHIHGLWLFLLPVAAAFGWWAAVRHGHHTGQKNTSTGLPRNYLVGLNYLLNEQPDKALDLFIKMLEVDSETVETHLALGNLFRRRGEVDRAIRIHQNLIARPNLDNEYRSQALLALAKDYLHAGVLDRAERLFLELIDMGTASEVSLQSLLHIYQQEKEWEKAIDIAQRIGKGADFVLREAIAHYYCELARGLMKRGNDEGAVKHIKRAYTFDKYCVRASLLSAELYMQKGQYKQAIRQLKKVKEQNPDFLPETIMPLVHAYQALGKEKELILYLKNLLKAFPRLPIVVELSEQIQEKFGHAVAINFVLHYLRTHPSIHGLHRLLALYASTADEKVKRDLDILRGLIERLLAKQANYQCMRCGFASKTLHWLCPGCKKWNTVKPTHAFD